MSSFKSEPGQNRFRRPVPQLFLWCALLFSLTGTFLLWFFRRDAFAFPKALWLILIWLGFFLALCALPYIIGFIVSVCLPKGEPRKEHGIARAFATRVIEETMFFAHIKVRIEGLEKLEKGKQYLFVSNHLSMFDPMIYMVYFYAFRILFVTKPENMKIPLGGPFMRFIRFQSINRTNPREAAKTLAHVTELCQADSRYSAGIYPEGTRSKTGELLPFHEGVFLVAKRAPLPVCVLHLSGIRGLTHRMPFKRTEVTIRVLDVLSVEDSQSLTTQEISEKIHAMMPERDV